MEYELRFLGTLQSYSEIYRANLTLNNSSFFYIPIDFFSLGHSWKDRILLLTIKAFKRFEVMRNLLKTSNLPVALFCLNCYSFLYEALIIYIKLEKLFSNSILKKWNLEYFSLTHSIQSPFTFQYVTIYLSTRSPSFSVQLSDP